MKEHRQMDHDALLNRAYQVDDLHRRSMDTFAEESRELHRPSVDIDRRNLIKKAGLGAAVLSFGSALLPVRGLMPAAFAQDELTDIDIGVFAESVELAAVAAYTAAADTGLLAPEVVEVGTLFASHHQEHAQAFAALVGEAATGEPNAAVLDVFGPMIADAADQAALLEIALGLEEGAAATYHFGLGLIMDPAVAVAPAQILPIESEHAVVLAQALDKDAGEYLPSFQNSEQALSPTDFPVSAGG